MCLTAVSVFKLWNSWPVWITLSQHKSTWLQKHFLTAVECRLERVDVTGGSWNPVDAHFLHASPLHLLHAAAHHMGDKHSLLSDRELKVIRIKINTLKNPTSDVSLHFRFHSCYTSASPQPTLPTKQTSSKQQSTWEIKPWTELQLSVSGLLDTPVSLYENTFQRLAGTYWATVLMGTQKTGCCWTTDLGGSSGCGQYFRERVTSTWPRCKVCLLHRVFRLLDSNWWANTKH